MFQYIATLLLSLVIWSLLKYIKWRKEVYCQFEKIRGPKTYPFIGSLYMFIGAKRSDIFKIFLKTAKEYGPFFRTYSGFKPEIVTIKPEHAEQILSSSVLINKGQVYGLLKEWLGDGLLVSEGAKWQQRRKMITPTFHFKILENFMTVFVEKSKLLLDYLEEKSDGKGFNVYPYITHCTLDVICETAMGVSINAMSDTKNNYTKALSITSELIIKRQINILQNTFLYPFLKDGRAFYENQAIMHNFTKKVIADRRKMLKENPIKIEVDNLSMSSKKRLSFLDLLLNSSETLTDADITAEVNTFMVGGHDTTTASISWTLFLLGLNQDIQEKAYQEIKNVLYDKKTPETLSDLNELKYLDYCIKESLRLYPSGPIISRHLTQDITLDGHRIPKGTDCTLNIYQLHRNPQIYPDPEKYDPDRFLPENCKSRHPYAYIPFSAGPRNCIGQKYAQYEEKTVLASILRSFRIIPVDTPETVNMVAEIVLRPEGGLRIALEKRTDF